MFAVMNKQKWESLPDDVKRIIDEVNAEWIDRQGEEWDAADREGRTFVEGLGKKTVALTDTDKAALVAAVAPMLNDYVAAMDAKGLPGRAVLDDITAMLAAGGK
jgi:TRAP-type C4-dicarboxylate transport system substrate-binding protein